MRHQNCAKAHTMKTLLVRPEGPAPEFQVKWLSNIRPHDAGVPRMVPKVFRRLRGNDRIPARWRRCDLRQGSEQMNILVE
ncbi:hypothetical protein ES703_42187 [subsurface metagenome]